jgi:hypothetical protein
MLSERSREGVTDSGIKERAINPGSFIDEILTSYMDVLQVEGGVRRISDIG